MDSNMYKKFLAKVIVLLLPVIMDNITPEIREYVVNWIKTLEEKAKKTLNPVDDVLVEVMKVVLNIV